MKYICMRARSTPGQQMVHPDLLEILVCPETRQPLTMAGSEILDRVNQAVEGKALRNQGGDRVSERIEEGLVREDGKVMYPVRDDIPVMLLDEAIRLDSLSGADDAEH